MSDLINIQNQIQKLQKQAADIKSKEFDKTVREILVKMQAFGITIKDLQSAPSRAGRSKSKAAAVGRVKSQNRKVGSTVAAKYRGPEGQTWSGRGLTPRWLSALITEGKTKEDFAIDRE
jgi:DNA-binding protein H-NS